jgi:hypothetical protein
MFSSGLFALLAVVTEQRLFPPVPVVNGKFAADSQGAYAWQSHEKVCHALLDAPASDNSALSASCLDLT